MSPNFENAAGPSKAQKQPRKINRLQPHLKRNAACFPCRRRRIKCDAARPHCSSCVRSYHFLARTYPDAERDAHGVQCSYAEDAPDVGHNEQQSQSSPSQLAQPKKRKLSKGDEEDGDPKGMVKMLEDKVAKLQKALEKFSGTMPSATDPGLPTPLSDVSDSAARRQPTQFEKGSYLWSGTSEAAVVDTFSTQNPHKDKQSNPMDGLSSSFENLIPPHSAESYNIGDSGFSPLQQPAMQLNYSAKPGGIHLDNFQPSVEIPPIDAEAGKMGNHILDILWPGWSPTLPSPSMLEHLVETFFAMTPSVPRILHRQSFLARLALPPSHPEFPQRALLHAICAAAARYSAAVSVRSVADGMIKVNNDAIQARGKGLDQDIASETCFSERNAIWMDGWVMIGSVTRLAICLGLLQNQSQYNGDIPSIKQSVLDPPKDDTDREERRATMYYALCYDVTASASSGWVGTMPTEELKAKGKIPENPQNFHSPDIFYNHPVADSFVMMIKGKILLGRASRFVRKCKAMKPEDRRLAKDTPEFKQIDGDIAMFNMSFPKSLRDPVQYMNGHAKGIDADLVSAHLVPHVVAIQLHEPFADLNDPFCNSGVRLLSEARACLKIVYLLIGSSADISYVIMPPVSSLPSSSYLFTASRALILFYQKALENGDQATAMTMHSEIGVFKMAFKSLSARFSMGCRHLTMVEKLMQHVEEDTLGHQVFDDDFSFLPRTHPSSESAPSSVSYLGQMGLPDTHPDSMMISELDKAAALGRHRPGFNSHAMMDQKRGYAGASNSRSNSIVRSTGPSHIDPLRWLDISESQQGASLTLLSPENVDGSGGSAADSSSVRG
ncbi:hypothetical protein I314_04981 [Cryptococcus bacillisporus CA1873]|uniref:Zn(2)-C6 fungal-type domain-containing protein n=1 Tax=Cryptococcus bacillisporus CA1873 TaxID=1296111 RepID=A0ABR5B5Y9_CRYGA|nr:hypothetical protein I314_04981 [Cryptococcus bacillisporus CA1873]|eukprot:KIR58997.1 hypothetical protein I314_04981 [Cryptococcus gattii CA1873]